MAADRLGGTRCRARHASIFSTSCGSTRMSIFAVFRFMPLRWGVAVLPRLLIPAKNLIARANPSENAAQKRADLLDEFELDQPRRRRVEPIAAIAHPIDVN